MRRTFAVVILLCIIYFLGGWIAVHFGWMSEWISEESYISYAGIVGAVASVVGLLSFTRPALTKSDLKEIELDSLKSITETSEQLKELEQQRAKTEEEIEGLDLQKREMELLVRKASLALLLREQYSRLEIRIIDEVKANPDLAENLVDVQDVSEKLSALNEEIEADPNVIQLKEIMVAATRRRESTFDEAIDSLPPITKTFVLLARDFGRAFNTFINVILR